jgi:hypothetical protein
VLEGLLERARRPDRIAEYQSELACPPMPEALEYIWRAFLRLHARRGSNGFAINPISWPDIDAFVRHSGMKFAPWEVELLEALDDLFRQSQVKPKAADG